MGSVEVLADLMFPFGSCANVTVMPHVDKLLALQRPQVPFELVKQFFIFVGITKKIFTGMSTALAYIALQLADTL